MGIFEALFDTNKREVGRIARMAMRVNELEPAVKPLTDAQLRERISAVRTEIQDAAPERQKDLLEQHLPEV